MHKFKLLKAKTVVAKPGKVVYNPNRKEVKGKTKKPERTIKMTTSEIIARYSWTPAEITTLETLGIDRIDEIFAAMDDTTFDKVTDYFTGWILRENPKARFNYWAQKAGVTEEMVNIYLTI